ncbi:gluconeogenesis factor YvcK family protein [Carnobacterium gallinarum]|uniref:gluconeogenesis factor YvcK family protein n=1 Tax=Carnobacterium gallinarum TaxID=2749 RepID=UPI0005523023|nr:YvcK family protein [Carnobacterium gallinarum]
MSMGKRNRKPKIVVIGGGTGLPVILKGLKAQNADLTAVVTVADDGGSSGALRNYVNVVPPGDIRNVLLSLSDMPKLQEEIFQYRFETEDSFLAGHAIGNLIIAAISEMRGNIFEAIQLLSKMMHVDGHVYPAAEEALVLHAVFEDGTKVSGESKIAKDRKKIDRVFVTPTENNHEAKASRKVIAAIMEADMVVLGPGSLFTSILPNLMISDLGEAVTKTQANVVYICNIMTQLGETENFSDADHVRVLHEHLGEKFIDTVLVNTEHVPEDYMDTERYDEYLVQVSHDFEGMRNEACNVISADFLMLRDAGVFHDGGKVVEELLRLVFSVNIKDQKIV